jgi:hypothetical protein
VTVPAGGAADATEIVESAILMLTVVEPMSRGFDVSVAVTVMGYVPAVPGVPDNAPAVLSDKPGGSAPASVQE